VEPDEAGTGSEVGTAQATDEYYDGAPTHNLTPMPFKDMPDPLPLGKVLGPSVILAGIGVGSGEYIIWPFIAANVGVAMLWAALVGVTLQFFLNMEIERYTLATGETAVAGFARYWKPFGILFCILAVVPFVFPGWATSAVTIASFLGLWGEGAVPIVSIIVLLAMGIALTISPVVYNTIEKAEFVKVGLTVLFLLVAIFAVLLPRPGTLADVGSVVTNFGSIQTSDTVTISVSQGRPPIDVPFVIGQQVGEATRILEQEGLSVTTEEVESNQPQGEVVGQNPEGGTGAEPGDTVHLEVSQGPPTRPVPDVTGRRCSRAIDILEDEGFEVVLGFDDDGRVLLQNPSGGTGLRPGSQVTIWCG
jgi:hypothetical protein